MLQECTAGGSLNPKIVARAHTCALQIEKEVRAFSVTSAKSVRSCIVVGGVSMQDQRHDLKAGAEVGACVCLHVCVWCVCVCGCVYVCMCMCGVYVCACVCDAGLAAQQKSGA